MTLNIRCENIFSEIRTTKRKGGMLLLIAVVVLIYWGCGSSNNSETSRITEGNGSGFRLAIRMQAGSDPGAIDRFKISVTGPGISLFDPVNRLELLTGESPLSVALGDVDGDSVLDVVTANVDSNTVSILLGTGDGSFVLRQTFSVGDGPSSVALGDVDGDGVLDVVTANVDSNDVSILFGEGDSSFFDTQRFSVGGSPISVALGDVDGDGLLDIVTANRGSNDVSILIGNGNGNFFPDRRFFVGGGLSSVALGGVNGESIDLDRDGFLDVVTTNLNENSLAILLSDTSLRDVRHQVQNGRVTIGGRDELVFYLTLLEEIPPGPNRTLTVRAFLPNSSQPDFIGSTTQTISRSGTSVVVNLNPTSSSE